MRFNCVARNENCLVDVEIKESRAVITIYSRDPAQTLLNRQNVPIDFSTGRFTDAETSLYLARAAIGEFEAVGTISAKSAPYVGELTPV